MSNHQSNKQKIGKNTSDVSKQDLIFSDLWVFVVEELQQMV
jgi:hypothetical protein